MSNYTIKCILCKADLRNLDGRDTSEILQPEGGVVFSGEGNYGSSFDYSATMVIGVCDECIEKSILEGAVLRKETVKVVKSTYTPVVSRDDTYDNERQW